MGFTVETVRASRDITVPGATIDERDEASLSVTIKKVKNYQEMDNLIDDAIALEISSYQIAAGKKQIYKSEQKLKEKINSLLITETQLEFVSKIFQADYSQVLLQQDLVNLGLEQQTINDFVEVFNNFKAGQEYFKSLLIPLQNLAESKPEFPWEINNKGKIILYLKKGTVISPDLLPEYEDLIFKLIQWDNKYEADSDFAKMKSTIQQEIRNYLYPTQIIPVINQYGLIRLQLILPNEFADEFEVADTNNTNKPYHFRRYEGQFPEANMPNNRIQISPEPFVSYISTNINSVQDAFNFLKQWISQQPNFLTSSQVEQLNQQLNAVTAQSQLHWVDFLQYEKAIDKTNPASEKYFKNRFYIYPRNDKQGDEIFKLIEKYAEKFFINTEESNTTPVHFCLRVKGNQQTARENMERISEILLANKLLDPSHNGRFLDFTDAKLKARQYTQQNMFFSVWSAPENKGKIKKSDDYYVTPGYRRNRGE